MRQIRVDGRGGGWAHWKEGAAVAGTIASEDLGSGAREVDGPRRRPPPWWIQGEVGHHRGGSRGGGRCRDGFRGERPPLQWIQGEGGGGCSWDPGPRRRWGRREVASRSGGEGRGRATVGRRGGGVPALGGGEVARGPWE